MQDTKKYWLITSNPESEERLISVIKERGFYFYSDMRVFEKNYSAGKIFILIEGFVLPKIEYLNLYKDSDSYEMIFDLFLKYKCGLIKYIKGNFNLIIIYNNVFCIFNDYLGLSKFFYLISGNNFKISNKYSLIINSVEKSINTDALLNFTLFQHFVGNESIFNGISYSGEASTIEYNFSLKISNYWSSGELINLKRENISYKDFAGKFNEIIKGYIEYLKPIGISLTLTGGRDTRTILSSLLNNNKIPDTYTFGNPLSLDVVVSMEISDKLGLNFENYSYNPDSFWYNNLSDEILKYDNPLIHLHRSHRFDAYKRDFEKRRDEMLFVGAMGGDYIKGAHLDDYILTRFVRQWYFEDKKNDALIMSFLRNNYIREDLLIIDKIREMLNHSEFDDENKKNMELKFVNILVGALHDYQDIFLANNVYKYCVTPFMDMDFLNLLFSSRYSLFDNLYATGNPFLMLKGSELQCEIINYLYSELSDINFAAGYTPKDVLGNKYIYMLKRIYLQKIKKVHSIQNFAYTGWMNDFVKMNFGYIESMSDIYDVDKLKTDYKKNNHKTTEGYWHKFTNAIMFGKLRERF